MVKVHDWVASSGSYVHILVPRIKSHSLETDALQSVPFLSGVLCVQYLELFGGSGKLKIECKSESSQGWL